MSRQVAFAALSLTFSDLLASFGFFLTRRFSLARDTQAEVLSVVWIAVAAALFAAAAAYVSATLRDALGKSPSILAVYLGGVTAVLAVGVGVAAATEGLALAAIFAVLGAVSAVAAAYVP